MTEGKSYLTGDEFESLIFANLHNNCPLIIRNVTKSSLCAARHYGGIDHNGMRYTYFHATDELIRSDVLKFITTRRKSSEKNKLKELQDSLF